MKNSKNLLFLLLFTILSFSCTPESVLDEESATTEDIFATGDNNSGTIDDEREDG